MSATAGGLLREVRAALAAAGKPDAYLEARLLLEHLAGVSRTALIADPQRPVGPEGEAAIRAALARRLAGEPLFRIFGEREFYGLRLRITAGTLEPRPDTEVLVDALVPRALAMAQKGAQKGGCRILDLGTGTGAIAIALLANVAAARAVGVDFSAGALETARANADLNGVGERFDPLRSDWFDRVEGRFDIIVSNPPYIPTADVAGLAGEVRDHDPRAALDGGADGLDAYRAIAAQAGGFLAQDGIVAVEIGVGQSEAVMELFARAGYRLIESRCDLAGLERALLFEA